MGPRDKREDDTFGWGDAFVTRRCSAQSRAHHGEGGRAPAL